MITLEKDFQAEFGPWVERHGWTFAYELKISHGRTLPFSRFEEQQLPNLYKVKHAIKNIKMTDASLGLKAFDGVSLAGEPAYVGVMFWIPDNQDEFYLLDIDKVLEIKQRSKSIKEIDCEKWGIKRSLRD